MGKYKTPELQEAFNKGRAIGRTEGMILYIKHISENMQKEAEKLSSKLQTQKKNYKLNNTNNKKKTIYKLRM